MRRVFGVVVLTASGLLAAEGVPSGAKEVQPHTYSYTDAQGQHWTYRQTPFGMTKWRDSDIPAPTMSAQPNPVTVTDLGEQVRFERKTPFGQFVWTRKKSELTADEKGLLAIAAANTEKK